VTDGRKDGRTDGSVTISLCNFVGEGITRRVVSDVIFNIRVTSQNISIFIYFILLTTGYPLNYTKSSTHSCNFCIAKTITCDNHDLQVDIKHKSCLDT
jgi:hypothetical protein